MELFPRWAKILGLDSGIEGRDIPLGGEPDAYRTAVGEIADDPGIAGALVTTHKVAVYQHAGSLFGSLDRYAQLCKEVSCISKRGEVLVGHAKDPITAGQALDHMLDIDYWRNRQADVLCMGAGGAGTAITVRLLTAEHRPARIVVTDVEPARIESLAAICEKLEAPAVQLVLVGGPEETEALLAELRPESLVVNATGMGKDLPGSPVSDAASFPRGAVVWDLNYRGELAFLRLARQRVDQLGLRIHDGWRYFLHGWTEVIAEVYALDLTPSLFERMARAAEPLRPSPPPLTPSPGQP
jgi:shikimate 5-dehydrogenase